MKSDAKLARVREQIDQVDNQILELLGQRVDLMQEVAKIKQEFKIDTLQPGRFEELKNRLRVKAKEIGVDPKLVDDIWDNIHEYSINQQNYMKEG